MSPKMAGNYWNSAIAATAIRVAGGMPETELSHDAVLLERFRSGDRDAFTGIYRAHSQRVFRFAMLMTGDSVKAAEATQDVFVWLVHHPNAFDPARGELSNLLVGVARNLLRKRFTEEQRWVPIEPLSARFRASEGSAEDGNADDAARLHVAIGALPESYRAVVVLCDLEEKSYERGGSDSGMSDGDGAVAAPSSAGIVGPETGGEEVPGMSDRYLAAKERLAKDYAKVAPLAAIEAAVLGEFDREKRSRRRRWVVRMGAVAAAVVIVASVTRKPSSVVAPAVDVVEERPFVAIPYVAPLAPYERAEVVRMTVPVAALMAAGLAVRGIDPGAQVEAEVVVGQDGRARALRLVEGN